MRLEEDQVCSSQRVPAAGRKPLPQPASLACSCRGQSLFEIDILHIEASCLVSANLANIVLLASSFHLIFFIIHRGRFVCFWLVCLVISLADYQEVEPEYPAGPYPRRPAIGLMGDVPPDQSTTPRDGPPERKFRSGASSRSARGQSSAGTLSVPVMLDTKRDGTTEFQRQCDSSRTHTCSV